MSEECNGLQIGGEFRGKAMTLLEPGGIVPGEAYAAVGGFGDEDLQGQIERGRGGIDHDGGAGPGTAEDEDFGGRECQVDGGCFGGMIDQAKDLDGFFAKESLESRDGLVNRMVADTGCDAFLHGFSFRQLVANDTQTARGYELKDTLGLTMKLRGFYIGRGQRAAAVLLLLLLAECLWTIARQPLDANDYRYAHCGREMWERPSVLQGYFTSCGNLNGDGTLAYRLAGFPLTAQRLVMLGADHFRKPENRLYAQGSLNGSTWEARHELGWVKYLLRLPFVLFALWLGGGLWWVAKRLFGPEGGALALGLYVFCPAIVQYATRPNNEVLAMWGLYGLVYTAMGVAHALQGPRRKWRPRIILLTVALGLTATAHLVAAMIGFVAGAVFFYYLAERRRAYVAQIMIFAALGAMVVVFTGFSFRLSAFLYVFTGGAGRFWFSTDAVRRFCSTPANAGIVVATLVSLVIYVTSKRSRYFGNTSALLMVLAVALVYTTQVVSSPWIWALPFLFTFVGGVFSDALETKHRKMFLVLTVAVVVTQAALCWVSLAGAVKA
jgi:hypothetical protein